MKTETISVKFGFKIGQVRHKPSSGRFSSDYFVLFAPNGDFIQESIFYDELASARDRIINQQKKTT